jgi:hypothetical protein
VVDRRRRAEILQQALVLGELAPKPFRVGEFAPQVQGFSPMELAGLEPATSWVRCSSSAVE